jgi:putative inorganic carbon (hco3(-)) transporter
LTEALQVAGCIAAVAAAGAALLTGPGRVRAAAIMLAMALCLALVLGEGWDELRSLRDQPAALAGMTAAAALGIAALAAGMLRWPMLLPLLLVAALPFRLPIDVDGEDVNLLLPLYAVTGAGVLATAVNAVRGEARERDEVPRLLSIGLVAAIALYALQMVYSEDIGFATRNIAFFLVPFAVLFTLLLEQRWTARLLTLALAIVVAEAVLFALVGIGQHFAGEIFWNPALEMSNDFHFYFRVNSLFWDPNIYGRYLALTIVLVVTTILWIQDQRRAALLAAALAVIFAGLVFAFSQTSFISLLFGVGIVCALRWSLRWTLIAAPLVAVAVIAGVLVAGEAEEQSTREVTEGRSTLISGGVDLALERPLAGYGSASFSKMFSEAEDVKQSDATSSHNEPVTVAVEQGIVGLISYIGLIALALWSLFAGMRRLAPGLGAPLDPRAEAAAGPALTPARAGLGAAFCALLVHTIGYAGYLTDPLTWTLLAVGGALAAQAGVGRPIHR